AGALAEQLGRLYATARSAADTNRALVTTANRLGARTRANFTGMAGESEAHILAAKGALDLMRGLAETQRLDGTEAALTSVRSAQQARQLKERALLDLGRFGRGHP
ncbi:MAG: hypothetical protein H3C62_00460, partial [Gemmatimonadaceae bacterium]|nr:hypothetical protein [Gemmatimonadaceae bacterium]